MQKKAKNLVIQFIKIAVAVGIVSWLVTSGKLNFLALQKMLSLQLAIPALLLVFFNIFFASERWRVLLTTQNIQANSWSVFKLTLIGSFFNFAMPGGVGGDVIKAYYFAKDHTQEHSKVIAISGVLMDRVLGLYAMIMMAMIVMFYDLQHVITIPALHSLFYVISALFTVSTLGLSIVFSKWIYEKKWLHQLLTILPFKSKTTKLYESMHLFGKSGGTVLKAILLSFFSQTCAIVFLYLAGYAAGIEVSINTYFLVAPLGFMATAIPISPAGVGVGQAAFYFLFNLYTGKDSELGPTVITAFQMTLLLLSLLGAFYYLRRKDKQVQVEKI